MLTALGKSRLPWSSEPTRKCQRLTTSPRGGQHATMFLRASTHPTSSGSCRCAMCTWGSLSVLVRPTLLATRRMPNRRRRIGKILKKTTADCKSTSRPSAAWRSTRRLALRCETCRGWIFLLGSSGRSTPKRFLTRLRIVSSSRFSGEPSTARTLLDSTVTSCRPSANQTCLRSPRPTKPLWTPFQWTAAELPLCSIACSRPLPPPQETSRPRPPLMTPQRLESIASVTLLVSEPLALTAAFEMLFLRQAAGSLQQRPGRCMLCRLTRVARCGLTQRLTDSEVPRRCQSLRRSLPGGSFSLRSFCKPTCRIGRSLSLMAARHSAKPSARLCVSTVTSASWKTRSMGRS
mmetsp:Transcript_31949/g.96136  ORF Transcript_31949/g.96136 Transcript_31949/m.96136 type:complete len:348 (+) Transcript_31949:590-1633(+)